MRVAGRNIRLGQALAHHLDQTRILPEGVGLQDVGTRLFDEAGDVDAGVIGACQQQRSDDGRTPHGAKHITKIRGVLLAETHPYVQAGA